MKKFMKKSLAVILALMLLSGSMVCLAAAEDKADKQYNSYVLLGDSIASGWSDVKEIESRFTRVEGSYGDLVAKDLGIADENYYPMACIGFRTVEMRYILEEDFEADRFLYYSIDKEEMDNVYAPAMRKAIAETDLITLNVGGNDWGSFLGWHVYEEMEKSGEANAEFLAALREYLETAGTEVNNIDAIIDIAALCESIPELAMILPKALEEGLTNFFVNWNYMIEDIYALNPDVTLLVIGMFDNSLQDPESEYVTVKEEDPAVAELKASFGQTIIDFANIPMIEGAKKYGYIYVDTKGTLCEEHHPSLTPNGGHRFIADKILEALPNANFPYTDVDKASMEFNSIEYLTRKGIMDGVTETSFAPDDSLTSAQLEKALFNITGVEGLAKKSDSSVSYVKLGFALYRASSALNPGIMGFTKSFSILVNTIFGNGIFGFASPVTRGKAAVSLMYLINN